MQLQKKHDDAEEKVVKREIDTPVWSLVHMLRTQNGLTLVEWTDAENRLRRSWITADMMDKDTVSGKTVNVDRPERGIPYGDNLANLVSFKADPEVFADALRRRGIWTYADVRVVDVQVALQTAYGIDVSDLMSEAIRLRKLNNQEN